MSKSRRLSASIFAAVTAVALTGSIAAAPAAVAEVSPARFNPDTDRPPEGGDPRSIVPMEQKTVCATSAVLPDSQFESIPINSVLGVDDLHDHATGSGQTVAIIDSGVNANARLPHLRGGGDYIMNEDGLSDCDHHGTLIAGIIGAQPARNDNFVGVAPDAELISIRQTSGAFGPRDDNDGTGASTLSTLARALVHAADEGATVINLSVTACIPAASNANLSELKGALWYAAKEKDAVVVSSAGNVDSNCTSNPGPDPADALDPRGWSQVESVSLPSYIDDFVLSVGGSTLTGDPYSNTMAGPWVDVAAPAMNVVSLDPVTGDQGGLINAEVTQEGTIPISGTSFASAYVSGLAALIREENPSLTSEQVRHRIINSTRSTARGMNNILGHGMVNPQLALTGEVSDQDPSMDLSASEPVKEGPRASPTDHTPAYVALAITAALAFIALVTASIFWFRHGGADIPSKTTRKTP